MSTLNRLLAEILFDTMTGGGFISVKIPSIRSTQGEKGLGDEGERRERSLTQTRPTLKHLLRSVANVQNIKQHIDVTHTYGMWKTQQQDNNIIQRAIFKFLCNRRTDGTLKCTTFTAVTQCHVNTFMSYNEQAST